jgi:hypothetical protein
MLRVAPCAQEPTVSAGFPRDTTPARGPLIDSPTIRPGSSCTAEHTATRGFESGAFRRGMAAQPATHKGAFLALVVHRGCVRQGHSRQAHAAPSSAVTSRRRHATARARKRSSARLRATRSASHGAAARAGHARRDQLAFAAEHVPARELARWVRRRSARSHWGRPNAEKSEGDFG